MIVKLEKPKLPNGRSCPALLNVWVTTVKLLRSAFFKVTMTERISKLCYRAYAQVKETRLKRVNAIVKLNLNRTRLANPPKTINVP